MYAVIALITVIGVYTFCRFTVGNTEYRNCLTAANYKLIMDAALKAYNEYEILRKEKEIFFSRKGYTYFILRYDELNDEVTMVGLDGYGLRDKYFHRVVCNLVDDLNNNDVY